MQLTNEIHDLLLSEIDNAIIVCDASGYTTWVNKTFETISEFTLHEVLGRKPGEILQGPDTAPEDVQAIREALSKNEPIKQVILNYTKSGRAYWNSLEIKPIFIDEKLVYYFSIQRDVTQQVLERNMLKAAETKYRKLFDNIAVGVTFIDYDGNILGCNDKELSIMGYDREEYYTKSIFELVESNYLPQKKIQHQKIFAGEIDNFSIREQRIRKDGTKLWVSVFSIVSESETEGSRVRINFTLDIQKEVLTERENSLLRQNIDSFLDAIPNPVFVKDQNHQWVSFNKAFCELTGLNASELLGKSDYDYFPKEQADIFHQRDRKVFDNNEISINEEELTNAKGEKRILLTYKHPFLNTLGQKHLIGVVSDITESIDTRNLLKESEKKLSSIIKSIPGVVYQRKVNIEGDIFYTYFSEYISKLTHFPSESLLKKSIFETRLIAEDDHQILKYSIQKLINNKSKQYEIRYRILNTNGQIIYVLDKGIIETQESENTQIQSGVWIDVTDAVEKEAAIAKSRMQTKALLDSTLHAFILLDKEQKILAFNQKAALENKLAFDFELRQGIAFPSENTPNVYLESFKSSFQAAIQGQTINHLVESGLKGFEHKYYEIQYLPVYNEEGEIYGVTYASLDVTDRVNSEKALHEKDQLITSITQNLQEAVYRSRFAGKLVYVNEAFASMFGYKNSTEVLNSEAVNLYAEQKTRSFLGEKLIKEGFLLNEEVLFKRKDGTSFWGMLSSNISIDQDGTQVFNGSIRDITELKKAKEELLAAKERAEELNRLKSNFLSNMSHEIRTPINGILGLAEIIDLTTNDEEVKEYIEMQKESGRRLLDTITSILNISKLESEGAKINLSPVAIKEELVQNMRPHQLMAEKKGLQWRVFITEQNPHVMCDQAILHQVLNNLLSNAIKFTEEGFVQVSLRLANNRKGVEIVEIEVLDSGVGISDQFLPKLFSPFEQESTGRKRKFEGSGLGLSITKKYIELLGGQIHVDSEKGKGTSFKVILPTFTN